MGPSKVSPGARGGRCTRPSRKTTPRSNCRTTRTLDANPTATNPRTASTMANVIMLTSHASSPNRTYDAVAVPAMSEAWLRTQPEISGLRVGYWVASHRCGRGAMATELGADMRPVRTTLFRIDPDQTGSSKLRGHPLVG